MGKDSLENALCSYRSHFNTCYDTSRDKSVSSATVASHDTGPTPTAARAALWASTMSCGVLCAVTTVAETRAKRRSATNLGKNSIHADVGLRYQGKKCVTDEIGCHHELCIYTGAQARWVASLSSKGWSYRVIIPLQFIRKMEYVVLVLGKF